MRKALLASLLLLPSLLATDADAAKLTGDEALTELLRVKTPEIGLRQGRVAEGEVAERCASRTLRQVRSALPGLAPASRRTILDLLGDSSPPSPRTNGAATAKAVIHKLSFWYETPNFSIEWGSDIKNEDGSSPARDANQNLIPDVVELWASYFEHSYAAIKLLGFTDGADPLDEWKISVYLGNSDPTATIDNIGGYYGFTDGDFPHLPGTPPAYITVSENFALLAGYSPNDESLKGAEYGTRGAMMATAAHELHHVFQYIYIPPAWGSATLADAVDWFLEGSSTWIEDRIFPFVNDYRQYYSTLNGWQLFPEYPLAPPDNRVYPNGSVRISRIYGTAIFPAYISEHLGGPAAFTSTWKHMKEGETVERAVALAADEAAGTTGKWSMEEVVLGFTATNSVMDYEDGPVFGTASRRQRTSARSTPFPEINGSSLTDPPTVPTSGATLTLSAPLPASKWGIAAAAPVDDAERSFSLILPTRTPKVAFTPPEGAKLTTVASYLGPSPTTWSFALNLTPDPPLDLTPPTKPGRFAATPATGGFSAEWTKSTDACGVAGYVVEWKRSQDPKWTGRTILGGITTAEVRGLSPEADYLARVFAYDLAGNLGEPSEPAAIRSGSAAPYPQPVVPKTLTIQALSDRAIAEGEAVTIPLAASDANALPITFAATGLPLGATLDGATFTWTPDFEQAGLHLIAFTAGNGVESVSAPLFVRVFNVNRPPLLAASPLTTDRDEPVESQVTLSDPDLGEVPTLSVKTPPSHGTVELTGPANYRFTPEEGFIGGDVFVLAATDASGASAEASVAVTVAAPPTPPNPPPAASSSGSGKGCFIETLSR